MKGIKFNAVMAISYSGYPNKPAPDALFALLKQLSLEVSETTYIGNGLEDLLTARNAKCGFIYLNRTGQRLPLKEDETEVKSLRMLVA